MSAPLRAAGAAAPGAPDHRCPLCGGTFAEESHCSVCPMTSHCHILCCPNCGYSFVEKSGVVDFFRRLFARPRGGASGGRGGSRG